MEIRSVRWSVYKAFVVAFNFRIEYGFRNIPSLSIHVALSLLRSCTHTVALSNSNFPFFYVCFHCYIRSMHTSFIAPFGRAVNRDVDTKKHQPPPPSEKKRQQQQSQSFFIVQKNCDPNDTSILQPDDLEPNMNCDYEVAVNVSTISRLYVKRKKIR